MTIEEVQRELEKAAANARRPYVLAQKANLARLEQLVADAEAARDREMAGGNVKGERFYDGAVTGLRRAVMVLEGRG